MTSSTTVSILLLFLVALGVLNVTILICNTTAIQESMQGRRISLMEGKYLAYQLEIYNN